MIPIFSFFSYVFSLLSILFNPALNDLWKLSYLSSSDNNLSFSRYYIKPYIRANGKTKNLVFIYAESLERTYFDENLFPGLIKELKDLQLSSTFFTNIKQLSGTDFTIAGMVSSQCGIPLFSPSHANGMSKVDKFLPGAICLGDLLNEQGYHLVYYGGDSLLFAGKGKFYSTHKFNEIYGKNELLPKLLDPNYQTSWGLFDDSLFGLAYKRFSELSQKNEKFALFLSTADTHFPRGNLSLSCEIRYNAGENPILNSVACADHLIANFINQVKNSPSGRETIVVLASDHLSMRNTAFDLLKKGERRNLFMILDFENSKLMEISTVGSSLDIASTLLPFIGYSGVVGLGRNLVSANPMVQLDVDYIHKNLASWVPLIYSFWDFPKINELVHIYSNEPQISIDDRVFGIPVLIELNDELETTLRFPEPWNVEGLRLIDYGKELIKNNSPFIWIDKCENFKNLDVSFNEATFCLIAGKGNNFPVRLPIVNDIKLTREEIIKIIGKK